MKAKQIFNTTTVILLVSICIICNMDYDSKGGTYTFKVDNDI